MWCASSLEIISVAPMINLKHKCYLFPRFIFLTEYLLVIFIKGSQANWPNNLTPYLLYGNCFPHRSHRPFYENIFNIICVTSEIILSFEKASGVDKISLNFVKLSAIILSDSFTKTINDSLSRAYVQMLPKQLQSHRLTRVLTIKTAFLILSFLENAFSSIYLRLEKTTGQSTLYVLKNGIIIQIIMKSMAVASQTSPSVFAASPTIF